MDEYTFIKGIQAYINVAKTYYELEKALYGDINGEGKIFDELYSIVESLMSSYLGTYYYSVYVFESCYDYIDECIFNKHNFDIKVFNTIVSNSLDAEANEA